MEICPKCKQMIEDGGCECYNIEEVKKGDFTSSKTSISGLKIHIIEDPAELNICDECQ